MTDLLQPVELITGTRLNLSASVSIRKILDIFPHGSPLALPRVRMMAVHAFESRRSRAETRAVWTELLGMLLDNTLPLMRGSKQLQRSPTGAPQLLLRGKPAGLNISIAHSDGWIAVGLSQGAGLGIDIERIRPQPRTDAISRMLGWSCDAVDNTDFWARWTLWEAYAKCIAGSVLNRENRTIEALAAERNPGRLMNNRQLAATCMAVDEVLALSVVVSGPLPENLTCDAVDAHALRVWK